MTGDKLNRYPDWEHRLYVATERMRSARFEWGEHDCAIFASDCIEAITGADLLRSIRGRYTTRIGAARVIKKAGFSSLDDMVADYLPEIPLAMVQRGDIVTCTGDEHGNFLAVSVGTHFVGPGENGIAIIAYRQAVRAFQVGVR